jgi:hypothetical protein
LGITSSSATASFSPAETLTWAGGGAGVGTSLTESRTDIEWTGDIDLATTGLFLGNAFGSAPAGGTWSGTITLTYDDVSGGTTFADWSGGEPFNEDKNEDGVENGLAFLLGAPDPDENARGLLPAAAEDGSGDLVLTFSCRNAATRGTSVLSVQHSTGLGAPETWLTAPVPDSEGTSGPVNGVTFNVVLGDPLNTVTATIDAGEPANGRLFGRVSGTE